MPTGPSHPDLKLTLLRSAELTVASGAANSGGKAGQGRVGGLAPVMIRRDAGGREVALQLPRGRRT